MKMLEARQEDLMQIIRRNLENFQYGPKLGRIIERFLSQRGNGHQKVSEHGEHVSILAKRVARQLQQDERLAFVAGLVHDLGKLTCPPDLFDGLDIDETEFVRVKRHAVAGYLELRHIDLELALIVGLHHSVYAGGYGILERDIPANRFSPDQKQRILNFASIISICDYIDADLTRLTTIKDGQNRERADILLRLRTKYPACQDIILAAVAEAEKLYQVELED